MEELTRQLLLVQGQLDQMKTQQEAERRQADLEPWAPVLVNKAGNRNIVDGASTAIDWWRCWAWKPSIRSPAAAGSSRFSRSTTCSASSAVGLFHWIFHRRFMLITKDPEEAFRRGNTKSGISKNHASPRFSRFRTAERQFGHGLDRAISR